MSGQIKNVAQAIVLLEGWKAALLAVLSGVLTTLALAPFHAMPVIFITLPVLVWLMDGAAPVSVRPGFFAFIRPLSSAFRVGWLFGFGYFLAGFWWVGHAFLVDADVFIWLLPIAVTILPAGLALFFGVACALARLAWTDNRPVVGWIRLVALACAFGLMEWVRGTVLTGLPWNALGYTIMPSPIFMQASSVIGLYGMSALAVLAGCTLLVAWAENRRLMVLPLALLIAQPLFGMIRLADSKVEFVEGVNLRLVQPALNQNEKWDPEKTAEIMQRYLDLSNANKGPQSASAASFTHIIWPESAFPFILTKHPEQLAAIAEMLPPQTSLITGAMRLEGGVGTNRKVYNSLYVIDGDGQIIEARDKTRLLPFGEFLPFQETLESLGFQQLTKQRGGFARGLQRSTVELANAPPFLPLICYEIIFSGRVRGAGIAPQWIVNVTNDAWFGMTSGPYQHAHQARVRAVEEGLPVVRVANNGISMVVDAYGRVIESLPLGAQGVVDAKLPVASPATKFYHLDNFYIILVNCFIFLALVGLSAKSSRRLH